MDNVLAVAGTDLNVRSQMRIGVAIATVDRTESLRTLCIALLAQTKPPVAIAICTPSDHDVPADIRAMPTIKVLTGAIGASAQRNLAVCALPDDLDAIAFFDDDTLPRCDYLEKAAQVLDSHAEVVGLTGHLICDGAREARDISPTEMQNALDRSWSEPGNKVMTTRELYGNNMVVRAEAARSIPFDERLPLYSWLEDLDFSRRLLRGGRLVVAPDAVAAHQGSPSGGRTQHRRLGYSQVSNVEYLRRKGSISIAEALLLTGKSMVGSLRGVLCGPDRAGRKQRLLGMSLALGDLARGRITPERISSL